MKKKWSVGKDPEWKVWLLALGMVILWVLTAFSAELTLTWANGTETVLGWKGWGDRLFPRILKMLP